MDIRVKRSNRMKVRQRMLWIFLPSVLLPLIIFGSLMFYSSYSELEKSSTQTYTQMTAQIGAVLTEYISRVDQTNHTVDELEALTVYLRNDFTSLENDTDTRHRLETEAMQSLAQLAKTNDGLYSLSVVTMDGDQISFVGEKIDRSRYDFSDPYYDTLRQSTSETVLLPVRQSDYLFSPRTDVFSVAYKHMDIPDGINMYTGYVICECPVSRLAEICANVDMGSGSLLFILDQTGTMAYTDADAEHAEAVSGLMAQGMTQGSVSLLGEECLLVSTRLGEFDWTVAAIIPYENITAQTNQLMSTFLLLCVMCGLIMVTVIIIQSGNFTDPIRQLQNAMKKVSDGDLTVRIKHNRTDEFGELNDGFNGLVDELSQLINDVSQSQVRENVAKSQMLQSQINPHFLYNTLDTIRMMAVLEDQKDIAEALMSLSKLFRYCIRPGSRLVTVREELAQARNYLRLQKLRYQERLEVEYRIDEAALDAHMPKVMLQPLLENAFAHGLRDAEGVGVITISIHRQQTGITFRVHDNGCGIDPVTLQTIRQNLSENKSESIGLANVNERLRLYYTHSQGLKIDSTPGEGTTVSFSVPLGEPPSALLRFESRAELNGKEENRHE